MRPEERIAEYDRKRRFRLYRPDENAELEHVMGAGAEDAGGLGVMIVQFHQEGEIDPGEPLGILDTDAWQVGEPGTWIVNPFASVWQSLVEAHR